MIDVTDFTTLLIVGVVVGVILLLVQRSWMSNARGGTASAVVSAGTRDDVDDVAVASDSQVTGDVRIAESFEGGSPRPAIMHNIERSPDASASDDDYGKVVGLLIFMAVAAILFGLLRPLLEAASYGAIVSTVLMALVAVYRTQQLRTWSARAVATVLTVAGACVVVVSGWRTIRGVERDGMSLEAIGKAVPAFSSDPDASLITSWFDYLVGSAFPAFFGFHDHVIVFVIILLGAAASQAALIWVALSAVWDWNAFLSFSTRSWQKTHLVARAKSHDEGGALGILIAAAVPAAIAIFSANGVVYDFVLSLFSG